MGRWTIRTTTQSCQPQKGRSGNPIEHRCPRAGEVPVHRYHRAHLSHLQLLGWRVWGGPLVSELLRHGKEFVVLVPVDATWSGLVPVLEEAA